MTFDVILVQKVRIVLSVKRENLDVPNVVIILTLNFTTFMNKNKHIVRFGKQGISHKESQ